MLPSWWLSLVGATAARCRETLPMFACAPHLPGDDRAERERWHRY